MTAITAIAGIVACLISSCAFYMTYQSYQHRTALNLIHAIEREQTLSAARAFVAHQTNSAKKYPSEHTYTNHEWTFQSLISCTDDHTLVVTNKIIHTGKCIASDAYILSL